MYKYTQSWSTQAENIKSKSFVSLGFPAFRRYAKCNRHHQHELGDHDGHDDEPVEQAADQFY